MVGFSALRRTWEQGGGFAFGALFEVAGQRHIIWPGPTIECWVVRWHSGVVQKSIESSLQCIVHLISFLFIHCSSERQVGMCLHTCHHFVVIGDDGVGWAFFMSFNSVPMRWKAPKLQRHVVRYYQDAWSPWRVEKYFYLHSLYNIYLYNSLFTYLFIYLHIKLTKHEPWF